jgi:hypothetical protein
MNMPPGVMIGSLAGFGRGPSPVTFLFSFLIDKGKVTTGVQVDGRDVPLSLEAVDVFRAVMIVRPEPPPDPDDVAPGTTVPLIRLAWGRSGDKGDLFNVGVIARRADYLPYIRAALTPSAVADWYRHFLAPGSSRVDRYDLPGFHALNLIVHESLASGINSSPRLDAAAKGMAQQLLEFPVPVSAEIAAAFQRHYG